VLAAIRFLHRQGLAQKILQNPHGIVPARKLRNTDQLASVSACHETNFKMKFSHRREIQKYSDTSKSRCPITEFNGLEASQDLNANPRISCGMLRHGIYIFIYILRISFSDSPEDDTILRSHGIHQLQQAATQLPSDFHGSHRELGVPENEHLSVRKTRIQGRVRIIDLRGRFVIL